MHVENGRMFSHGTLMYDVDQTQIAKALTVPTDKLASKGIKSVRSRVTNLKPYMAPAYQHLTIEEFRTEPTIFYQLGLDLRSVTSVYS